MKKRACNFCRKQRAFVPVNLIFFCVTYGFFLFFISLGMTGMSLLHTLARMQCYICCYMVCISYYVLSAANRYDVKEVSESIASPNVFETAVLRFISLILLFWNSGILCMLICGSLKNDGTSYFLTWFPANYLVNILFPQMICLLFTYLTARSKNHQHLFLAEIGFLFLISPLSEKLVWEEKPALPVDLLWETLRSPFKILYQNGEWSPNLQTSMQLEPSRIALSIFWLLLFGTIRIWDQKKRLRYLSAILAGTVFLYSCQPASLYRLDRRWNGIFADYTTYELFEADLAYQPSREDYVVSSYRMDIRLRNQLEVNAALQIEAPAKQNEFLFTLYHGYHIKSVRSGTEGISVSCRRDGDSLILTADRPVTSLLVQMEYQGFHHKFYSNRNEAMLPGWFPWYPMAGEKQILLEYPEYGRRYGYNPYNRIVPAEVTLTCDKKIYTNLEQTKAQTYFGKTDGITLIRGNIAETKDPTVQTVLPLALVKGEDYKTFVDEETQHYEQMLKQMERLGFDTSAWEKKKILFVSKDLARNVSNNWIAVFDDHILTIPGYLTADELFRYMVLQDSANRQLRMDSAVIPILLSHINLNLEPEQMISELKEKLALETDHEKLLEAMDRTNAEIFVQKAVDYILRPDVYGSDQTFYQELENADDRD